jgi:hypothetical protein
MAMLSPLYRWYTALKQKSRLFSIMGIPLRFDERSVDTSPALLAFLFKPAFVSSWAQIWWLTTYLEKITGVIY